MDEWWPVAFAALAALGMFWIWLFLPRRRTSIIGARIARIVEVEIHSIFELEPMFGRRHPLTTAYTAFVVILEDDTYSNDDVWNLVRTHLEVNGTRPSKIQVLGDHNTASPTMILHGRTCIPMDGLTLTCANEDQQQLWPLTLARASASN